MIPDRLGYFLEHFWIDQQFHQIWTLGAHIYYQNTSKHTRKYGNILRNLIFGNMSLKNDDFKKIGAKFANPRNADSGSLRQKDPLNTSKIPLKFIAYTYGYAENLKIETQSVLLKNLKLWGFKVNPFNKTIKGIKNLVLNHQETESKSDVLYAFEKALEMEQHVYEKLLELHTIADKNDDPQFCDYLESDFLEEQVESINELSKIIAQLRRIGNDNHGIWNFCNQFDKL